MKSSILLTLSYILYGVMAILFVLVLLMWEQITGRTINNTAVISALLMASVCVFLAYYVLKIRLASFKKRRNIVFVVAGICGIMSGIAGLGMLLIIGIPLLSIIIGMPDLWKSNINEYN